MDTLFAETGVHMENDRGPLSLPDPNPDSGKPGKRWGEGVASILPFLARALKSRPHGLDEESCLGYIDTVQEK